MSTSGVTTFSVTRNDLINSSLRKLGVLAQGETPTTDQVTEAAFALNLLVKSWEADGMPLWALRTISVPLQASVNTYTIGPAGCAITNDKPLKVIQAWNRTTDSNVDIPMRLITKQEYAILGNKTSLGTPSQVYYEPLRDTGVIRVFPTPDSTTATSKTLYITYQKPYDDFTSGTDNPDFPQEWYDAIVYGLALRLAPEYGIPGESRVLLGKEAEAAKQLAMSFGTEEGSLYFQRDYRNW